MRYPVTIVDDFFSNPDAVRELALSHGFTENHDYIPGQRTERLHIIEPLFYEHFVTALNSIFGITEHVYCDSFFQTIKHPFPKTDPRNKCWLHTDRDYDFGGIVYLNPDPDPDTGTDIYRSIGATSGFSTDEKERVRKATYTGEIDLPTFEKTWDDYHSQFKRTVTVDNVFNRLVCFDSTTYHRVRFNGNEDRLTLPFFVQNLNPAPLRRILI